jgi:TRAP-type C4-dicarboxylate transport system permease small subunit
MHETHLLMFKSVAAFVVAGALYVADSIATTLTDAPNWVTQLGLPTAMLLLSIAGIVGLFKALLEERRARILDRDGFIETMLRDAKEAAEARSSLIEATREQTREFRSLCDELRKK